MRTVEGGSVVARTSYSQSTFREIQEIPGLNPLVDVSNLGQVCSLHVAPVHSSV